MPQNLKKNFSSRKAGVALLKALLKMSKTSVAYEAKLKEMKGDSKHFQIYLFILISITYTITNGK